MRAVIFKNRKSLSDICFMANTIGQIVLTTILRQGTISFAFKISRPFHIKVLNWLLHMNNICFEIPKFMSMGRWEPTWYQISHTLFDDDNLKWKMNELLSRLQADPYWESSQTSKPELLAKTVNRFQPLSIF